MPNTGHGLPYPNPTDPVAQGAAAIQALAAALDGKLAVPIVQARMAAPQNLATGVWTLMQPAAEDVDTDNQHDNVTKPHRLTCKFAGVYLVWTKVEFTTVNVTGGRTLDVRKNDNDTQGGSTGGTASGLRAQAMGGSANTIAVLNAIGLVPLALNDYLTTVVYHDAGATLPAIGYFGWLRVA